MDWDEYDNIQTRRKCSSLTRVEIAAISYSGLQRWSNRDSMQQLRWSLCCTDSSQGHAGNLQFLKTYTLGLITWQKDANTTSLCLGLAFHLQNVCIVACSSWAKRVIISPLDVMDMSTTGYLSTDYVSEDGWNRIIPRLLLLASMQMTQH